MSLWEARRRLPPFLPRRGAPCSRTLPHNFPSSLVATSSGFSSPRFASSHGGPQVNVTKRWQPFLQGCRCVSAAMAEEEERRRAQLGRGDAAAETSSCNNDGGATAMRVGNGGIFATLSHL